MAKTKIAYILLFRGVGGATQLPTAPLREALSGADDLHHFAYPRPTILALGEERGGLSSAQIGLCTDQVRIPMIGAADSLNLAVAGSLFLSEVYRSRDGIGRRSRLSLGKDQGSGR